MKDNNINFIKMKISIFKHRNDADAYLEWEHKFKLIFECHNYSKEKNAKLAAVELTSYTFIWWDQQLIFRHRNYERPIEI